MKFQTFQQFSLRCLGDRSVFVPVIPGGLFLALMVAMVTKQDKKYKNILISCYSLRIPGNTFAKEHIKK